MTDKIVYDADILSAVAARLHVAGDELDAKGAGAPPSPDAGDMTAAMASLMARLITSAATLPEGLSAAAGQVTHAGVGHIDNDWLIRRDFQRIHRSGDYE